MLNSFEPHEFVELARRIEGDDDVDVVELANFIVTLARSKVRRVRTPEGSRYYGLPIGAIITRDAITRAKLRFPKQKPPAGASKVSRKKISDFKPKTRTANKKLVKALKSDPAFTKPKLITPKGDKKVKVKNSEFNVPSGSRVFRAKDDDSYAVVRTPGYDLIGVTDKGVAFDIKGESEQILNDRFDDFKKDDPEFSSETIGKQSSKDLGPDADVDQADGADGADKSKKKDDYDQYESYEDVPEYLSDERIKRIVDSLDDSGVDPEVTRELDTQLRKLDNETKKKWEAARSPEAAKSKQNTAETEKIGGLDNGKRKEADRPEREAGQLGGTSDRSSGEGGVPPKVSSDAEGPGGQKDGDTERREDRGSDSSRVLTVGGREVRTVGAFNPSEEDAKRLQDEGLPTPTLYELSGPEGVEAFHAAMEGLKNEGNPYAASVYVYSPEEYAGMRLFVNEDGKSGLALKGDELVSGFSYRDSKFKGSVASNLSVAIELGGRRADCFDTVLPALYAAAGLVPVARMKFDDEYAPDGWDYDLYEKFNGGRPDVVFLAYDKDRVGEKYDPTEGRYVTEYDDGALAQKDAIQGVKAPEAKPETLKTRDQSDTTGKDPESMSPEQLDDVIADFEDFKAAGGSLTEAGKERLDSLTKERDRRTKEPVVRPEKTSKPSQPLKVSNKPFGDQRISDDEMRKQGISAGKGEFSVETVDRNDILNSRIGDKFIHRNELTGKESLWGLEEDGKFHRLSGDDDDVSVTPDEFAALLEENSSIGKSEVFGFSGNKNNEANRPSPKPGDVASTEWAKNTKAGSVANDGSGLVSTKNENGKWDTPLGEFPEDFIGPSDIENDDSVVIQDGPNDDGRPVGASSKVTNAADVDAVKPGSTIVLSGKDNVLERKQDGNFEADIDGLKFDLPAKDVANSGEVASGRAWHVPDQDLDTPVAKNLKTGDKIPNLVDAREQSPGSKLVLDQQDGTKRSYTVLPDGQLFDDETKKSLPAVVLRDSILGGRVTLGEVASKGADLPEVPAKKITNVSDYEDGDAVVDYKHLRDMKPGQQATILVKSSKNGGKSLPVVLTRTDDTKDNAGFMFLVGKRGAGYNSFGENNASIFQAIADGRFYFGDITTLPGSKQPEVINSPWDTSPDIKLWEDGPNVSEKDLWDFINAQVYSRAMQGSYYNVDLLPKDSPFRSHDLRKKFSVLAIDKYSLHDEKGRIVVPARHKPAMIRLAADKLGLEYTDPGSALIPEDLELSDFNEKVTVGKWLRKRGSLYNPAEANMGSEQIEVSKADIKIALSVLDNMLVPDSDQDPDKILKRDMAMRGSPLQDMNTSVAIAAYFGMRRSKDGVLTYEIGRQYDKQNNKALLRQMLLEQMEGREPGYYGLPEDEVYIRKGSTYVNYSTLSRPAINVDNDTDNNALKTVPGQIDPDNPAPNGAPGQIDPYVKEFDKVNSIDDLDKLDAYLKAKVAEKYLELDSKEFDNVKSIEDLDKFDRSVVGRDNYDSYWKSKISDKRDELSEIDENELDSINTIQDLEEFKKKVMGRSDYVEKWMLPIEFKLTSLNSDELNAAQTLDDLKKFEDRISKESSYEDFWKRRIEIKRDRITQDEYVNELASIRNVEDLDAFEKKVETLSNYIPYWTRMIDERRNYILREQHRDAMSKIDNVADLREYWRIHGDEINDVGAYYAFDARLQVLTGLEYISNADDLIELDKVIVRLRYRDDFESYWKPLIEEKRQFLTDINDFVDSTATLEALDAFEERVRSSANYTTLWKTFIDHRRQALEFERDRAELDKVSNLSDLEEFDARVNSLPNYESDLKPYIDSKRKLLADGEEPEWYGEFKVHASNVPKGEDFGVMRTEVTPERQKAEALDRFKQRYGTLDPKEIEAKRDENKQKLDEIDKKIEDLTMALEEWNSAWRSKLAGFRKYWPEKTEADKKLKAEATRLGFDTSRTTSTVSPMHQVHSLEDRREQTYNEYNKFDYGVKYLPELENMVFSTKFNYSDDVTDTGELGEKSKKALDSIKNAGGALRKQVTVETERRWWEAARTYAKKSPIFGHIDFDMLTATDLKQLQLQWTKENLPGIYREYLEKIRPMNGRKMNFVPAGNHRPGDVTKMTGEKGFYPSEGIFPSEWLDKANAMFPTIHIVHSNDSSTRGSNTGGSVITLTPTASPSTPAHELAHTMEYAIPGIKSAEWAFFYSRNSKVESDGIRRISRLNTQPDDFSDRYSGRIYLDNYPRTDAESAFEVLTVGIQGMLGDRNAFHKLSTPDKVDEDYLDFILGVLSTL